MTEYDQIYEGNASHPDFGEATAHGTITVGSMSLRFESELGTVDFPMAELKITFANDDESDVFFSHPKYPKWTVFTSNRAILEDPAFQKWTHLRRHLARPEEKRQSINAWIVTAIVLVLFLGGAIVLSSMTGWMVRVLVAGVPTSFETTLGDSLMEEVRTEETLVDRPELVADLDQLIKPLTSVLPRKDLRYRFYIADEPAPNAFALPGGHIIVTTGLLALLEKPEELAGVLAHEIAHVTLRHGFRKIISSAGPYYLARLLVGNENGVLVLIANGSQMLIRSSYSRDYEREADNKAWEYLLAAKIDPRGYIEGLRRLQSDRQLAGMAQFEASVFSTHPPTEERILNLETKWASSPRKSGFIKLTRPKLPIPLPEAQENP
ncbi:MAG: M48 family metallopeptidase [Verrucomicrobiota bacterium]